jgi:hypothetical protein
MRLASTPQARLLKQELEDRPEGRVVRGVELDHVPSRPVEEQKDAAVTVRLRVGIHTLVLAHIALPA